MRITPTLIAIACAASSSLASASSAPRAKELGATSIAAEIDAVGRRLEADTISKLQTALATEATARLEAVLRAQSADMTAACSWRGTC